MAQSIPPQHILVVDDEPMVQETLEMVLIHQGHTVVIANNGPEALQKVAEKKFDVVLTDYHMPEMLGDELAGRIRETYPDQVIVMISAYTNFLTPYHKEEIAVDFFVNKPFQLTTILDALKRAHEINEAKRKLPECLLPPPDNHSRRRPRK